MTDTTTAAAAPEEVAATNAVNTKEASEIPALTDDEKIIVKALSERISFFFR